MDTKDTNTDLNSGGIIQGTPPTPLQADLELNEGEELSATAVVQEKSKKTVTPFQESLGKLRRDKRAMVSFWVLIFLILLPIFGPLIYTHVGGTLDSATNGPIGPSVYHNPYHIELVSEDLNPSAQYWLGTDSVGRDMFARLMQGLLISISVALAVEVIDIALGITIGVLAGYYGGWIDQVLARFTDVMFAFPGLLFAIMLTGIFGYQADAVFSHVPIVGANGDARLILVSLALALTTWPLMARYVRGQTLQLKEQQFVEAARTSGASDFQIIQRHIVPNLMSIVIIAASLNISGTIIGEAGLSFLGLGVQTPGSSLGLMISDALNETATHPWEVLLPSFVLTIIVLALSFLGDGLRDAFDPRSKD